MEEQQVRWSQSSLEAAEGGFGVAESLLLGHIHPLSRAQLTKKGHLTALSREGVVLEQPQCPGFAQWWRDLSGDYPGATRRRVLTVEAEVQEGVGIGTASPLLCAGQKAQVRKAAAVSVKHKQV